MPTEAQLEEAKLLVTAAYIMGELGLVPRDTDVSPDVIVHWIAGLSAKQLQRLRKLAQDTRVNATPLFH